MADAAWTQGYLDTTRSAAGAVGRNSCEQSQLSHSKRDPRILAAVCCKGFGGGFGTDIDFCSAPASGGNVGSRLVAAVADAESAPAQHRAKTDRWRAFGAVAENAGSVSSQRIELRR